QYVEVIAVTAGSGYDANTGEQEDAEEKELPSTVTLLVTPEQSKILAMLEADGNLHISLVYRGSKENAAKFIEAQQAVLTKLYPSAEEESTKQSTEEKQESSESEESTEQTVPSVSANTYTESEAE
ncbi:MAG: RcpC/CpaB family pilus assembly protein, partial [Hungatella sp.]